MARILPESEESTPPNSRNHFTSFIASIINERQDNQACSSTLKVHLETLRLVVDSSAALECILLRVDGGLANAVLRLKISGISDFGVWRMPKFKSWRRIQNLGRARRGMKICVPKVALSFACWYIFYSSYLHVVMQIALAAM